MREHENLTRRAWLGAMLKGAAVVAAVPTVLRAAEAPAHLTVYKDPSCGCCKKWVEHLQANGFTPAVIDRQDMDSLKDSLGVPQALRSCHTALAGKYVIEGHVPASDIKKLMAAKPKDVIGLAAPGMPAGSPGMEMGGKKDRFDVIAFSAGGRTRVFAAHS